MTAPRRRILRPGSNGQAGSPQRQRQAQRLRDRLAHERTALVRWQKRFKRAYTAVMKHQAAIVRTERQLARLEKS